MVTGIQTVATGILTVVTDREPIQPDVGRVNLSASFFLYFFVCILPVSINLFFAYLISVHFDKI